MQQERISLPGEDSGSLPGSMHPLEGLALFSCVARGILCLVVLGLGPPDPGPVDSGLDSGADNWGRGRTRVGGEGEPSEQ